MLQSHAVQLAAWTESIVTVPTLDHVGRSCYCIHGNSGLNEIYLTKRCAFCFMNLLHFSVVSTALSLEMTESKMSWIMITKSLAFIELSLALSPSYNRNVTSKIKTDIYICIFVLMFTCTYSAVSQNVHFCRLYQETN